MSGTGAIHRDRFVRTDQTEALKTTKCGQVAPIKSEFCKDFVRTGRDYWRTVAPLRWEASGIDLLCYCCDTYPL